MHEMIRRLTQDPEERMKLARVCDLAEQAAARGVGRGDFLDPRMRYLAEQLMASWADISWEWQGGYAEAERSRLVLFGPYAERKSFIRVLNIKASRPLKHRDCLGAILGLGVKREKIGDLVVENDTCQAVLAEEIVGFVAASLAKIGQQTVEIKAVKDALEFVARPSHTINATVASLRLDALIAAGFGLSRSQAAALIAAEKVRVNYGLEKRGDRLLSEGDVISVRGLGRLKLAADLGKSRKDRFKFVLERY